MSLPAADELFRRTGVPQQPTSSGRATEDHLATRTDDETLPGPRAPSRRIRHDEKMTVYVTADELLDIEDARLSLRRAGLSVDRGRLVREAIARSSRRFPRSIK
ncbi:MAG: hypothetical protein ABI776_18510 [Nocardioidaceae bacterium]